MVKYIEIGIIELLEYGDGLEPDLTVHNIPDKIFKKLISLGEHLKHKNSEWVKINNILFFKNKVN